MASTLRAAEPNKVYRMAWCVHYKFSTNRIAVGVFDHLRQLGYIEGKNLIVDRFAAEDRRLHHLKPLDLGTALIAVHKDSSQYRASLGKAALGGRIR
jgi:hypothetical protein